MSDRVEYGKGWEMRLGRWQESPVDECDHVISDPPYTDHVSTNQRRCTGIANGLQVDKSDLTFMGLGGGDIPHMVDAFTSSARRWVIIWCAVEQVGDYQRACPDAYVRGGVWVKTNPTPQFSGDRPAMWGEACAILHGPSRKRWHGGGHPAKWVGPYERNDRHHETQKPLWLMTAQVEQFTDPGDLIWDPYAGSATTGVAALLTGRRFVGHEMQERYFEIAVERLRATNRGTTLDAAMAGQMTLIDAMGEDI